MRSMQGKLYLAGAFSLAGTSVITGYLLSAKLSGFTITAVSMAIVLISLFPFYAKRTLRTVRALTRRDWRMLFFQAVLGIFLFRMFLLLGVTRTSTAEAGILTGTTPAITAVMAFFLLRERLSAMTAAGVAGTVAGILLLQGSALFSARFSGQNLLGNAFVLCAAASESAFNILSRKHKAGEASHTSAPIHPMVQTLLVSAITLCLAIVPALTERPLIAIASLGLQEWLALIWYGIIVTALAFALFYAGARRCGAYIIAAFSGMMPLTSMILSVVVLQESIMAIQWAGGALILLGMVLIGQNNRRNVC
ncbi:MAG: DMT family transporter [Bacillota bacterium]